MIQVSPLMQKAVDFGECKHCASTIASKTHGEFCCHGCELAYELIQKLNLEDYYRIQKQLNKKPPQAKSSDATIDELYDHPDFQARFCESSDSGRKTCHLYVDNLSCYACVWVCEQAIRKLHPDVRASVNLASGRALVDFDPKKTKLSQVVDGFSKLGYPVSPDRNHSQQSRKDLARIGIAGFCLMNLMILALAEYVEGAAIEAFYFQLFRWISFGLASICLVFAARPFYENFIRATVQGEIHMDMPISIALISTYLFSSYHVVVGEGPVYFDSLVGIVFLLLSGRYFQKKSMEKHLRQTALQIKEQIEYVRKVDESGEGQLVPVSQVKRGERLRVLPGGMLPVKAELLSEQAELSSELMTGEARWVRLKLGEICGAGSINGSSTIEVRACENGLDSYLQRLKAASARLGEGKSSMLHLSKKMSQFLTVLVMLVGFTTLFVFWSEPHEAIARFCAILLIACPCAFGLGTPLILARAFDLGLKKGVLWNHPRGLEQLSQVKTFYFDKTGTLTKPFGKIRQIESKLAESSDGDQLVKLLARLNEYHDHHMIQLLVAWAKEQLAHIQQQGPVDELAIEQVKEQLGQGLCVLTGHGELRIGRPAFVMPELSADQVELAGGHTWLAWNGEKLAAFDLEEMLADDVKDLMQGLRNQGSQLAILSGDAVGRVSSLIEKVEMPEIDGRGGLSPLAKLSHVGDRVNSELRAMVGNGFNDGPAMARAELGIAVADAAEMAQKNADMILLTDRLSSILDARDISRRCRGALARCFGFSFSYNLLGMTLGATGLLSPVVAALLMPFSSLTVITLARKW